MAQYLSTLFQKKAKRNLSLRDEQKQLQFYFLMPLFISMLALVIIPMVSLFGLSFTNYKLTSPNIRFTGLENYIDLLQDKEFIEASLNTIFMVSASVILQMGIGILGALAIQRMKRFRNVAQSLIIMPMVIPPVVVGLMFSILLIPTYGGIHALLYSIGIENAPAWLTDATSARWVLILVSTWEWTPFVILFVIAALDSLPVPPFEAAKIDGANFFQEFFFLTLPLIRPVLEMTLVFRIIEGLKIFPLVFSLTQGGPGNATEELTYFAYKEGFVSFKMGYASASSMLMFICILALIVLFYGRKRNSERS